jgi:hypothetical protein
MTTNQKVVGSNPAGLTFPEPMKTKAPGFFDAFAKSPKIPQNTRKK